MRVTAFLLAFLLITIENLHKSLALGARCTVMCGKKNRFVAAEKWKRKSPPFEKGSQPMVVDPGGDTGVGYTVSLRRCLRRRAFSTRRPPTVCMRTRKPWVFFRFLELG